MQIEEARQTIQQIRTNIEKVMVGKRQTLDLLLIALLSRGHVLLEDIPGIGKTTLVSAMARSLGMSFKRIQFTPDVMPSDITGFTLFNPKSGEFEYRKGAIMSQLILADEINRTSPKTQSSLLEAMQENQVTVDGKTYAVPQPFMVMATQNPIEHVGTYPLPEAQLDRFMLKVSLGYPTIEEEMLIYDRFSTQSPLFDLKPVLDLRQLQSLQKAAEGVHCAEAIRRYIAFLAHATRAHADLELGVSPRGALMLLLASRGMALLSGRSFVTPDDVRDMLEPVFAHRILLKSQGHLKKRSPSSILEEVLQTVPVPES